MFLLKHPCFYMRIHVKSPQVSKQNMVTSRCRNSRGTFGSAAAAAWGRGSVPSEGALVGTPLLPSWQMSLLPSSSSPGLAATTAPSLLHHILLDPKGGGTLLSSSNLACYFFSEEMPSLDFSKWVGGGGKRCTNNMASHITVEAPQVPKIFLPILIMSFNWDLASSSLWDSRRELGPCFKTWPAFVIIRYSKMKDMETTAFKRRVYYSQIPRGGGMPHHTGPHGKAPGWSGGRRSKRKHGHKPLLWFSQEKKGKADK